MIGILTRPLAPTSDNPAHKLDVLQCRATVPAGAIIPLPIKSGRLSLFRFPVLMPRNARWPHSSQKGVSSLVDCRHRDQFPAIRSMSCLAGRRLVVLA